MISISVVGCFLFLNACATHTGMATTSVSLKVTSKTETKWFVNHVRDATLAMIEKQVPGVRPMTVTATVDVVSERVSLSSDRLESVSAVSLSYRIAGVDGRVLESKQAQHAGHLPDDNDPYGDGYRRTLAADTAGFLASRVAALSH
jgi:hypothetical protein